MPMTDTEIAEEARRIAHENSSACKNRPAIYADQGHGKACDRLYLQIKAAMQRAAGGAGRDSAGK